MKVWTVVKDAHAWAVAKIEANPTVTLWLIVGMIVLGVVF